MLRREFLATAFARRIDYRDYSRILPDYLARLAAEAYRKRNAALAAITTADAARERQRWARSTFWRLIGGELERTPLKLKTVGSFDRPGYKVEKLIYESRPGFPLVANLYIPKNAKPPFPGVLLQMGHSQNGKAYPQYQYCCQGLAQLGFLVLAFDPMGQGERTYYPKPGGTLTRLASSDDEHTVPGKQLILAGDTSSRFQVWDSIRSLDVLASHPLVDPRRLASTGNSGGGTTTMMLAAVDDRLTCAAPACGNTENLACANFNAPGSTDDAEQDFLFSGPEGFDRWDTLYPIAPKPMLIINSGKDFFGTYSPRYIENGREEFAKLERFYSLLGKPSDLVWHETPLPHGLSYDVRLEIYRFFQKHMQGNTRPLLEEPPVKAEVDATLYVTKTGNVVRDLDSKTPYLLARERAGRIVTPAKPKSLPKLLAYDDPGRPKLSILGETVTRNGKIFAVEVESAPGVFLPAWIFQSKPNAPHLLLLEHAGRNGRWGEDSLCQQLMHRGYTVIAPDLRGIGDLLPEYPRNAPRHGRSHQSEEAYAWSSLILGKPLLGQRVTDLVAIVRAMNAPVRVAALDTMTVPAAFAMALEPSIELLHCSGGLASYRSLLEGESYSHPFANFLPGVLEETDLPQLLAGRRVIYQKEARWDLESLARL